MVQMRITFSEDVSGFFLEGLPNPKAASGWTLVEFVENVRINATGKMSGDFSAGTYTITGSYVRA